MVVTAAAELTTDVERNNLMTELHVCEQEAQTLGEAWVEALVKGDRGVLAMLNEKLDKNRRNKNRIEKRLRKVNK